MGKLDFFFLLELSYIRLVPSPKTLAESADDGALETVFLAVRPMLVMLLILFKLLLKLLYVLYRYVRFPLSNLLGIPSDFVL